ncbi:hypothetical protein HDU67_003819 [Dinochytrium kinnereticum]|nr:hypothetical protein HDU67_003819 [Dinochytrium kinnereticum]
MHCSRSLFAFARDATRIAKPSRHCAFTTSTISAKPVEPTLSPEESAKLSTFISRSGLSLQSNTLVEALTHRSYKESLTHLQSGRFQVIGEKVLTFLVSEYLFSKYPTLPAHALLSSAEAYTGSFTLANVGRNIGVPFVMRSGIPAAEKDRESVILAKVIQALVGALYMEKGSKAAKEFIMAHILSRQIDISLHLKLSNPKALLQTVLKKAGKPSPVSRLLKETGRLSSTPVFIVGIYSGVEKIGEGFGSSLAMAETRAARNAIEKYFVSEAKEVTVPSDEVVNGDELVFTENVQDRKQ